VYDALSADYRDNILFGLPLNVKRYQQVIYVSSSESASSSTFADVSIRLVHSFLISSYLKMGTSPKSAKGVKYCQVVKRLEVSLLLLEGI
jgi:hypothetical protein